MANEKYNGWVNYETWNVGMWIANDEGLYRFARECGSYAAFAGAMIQMGNPATDDGVAYDDDRLDLEELEECVKDLAS